MLLGIPAFAGMTWSALINDAVCGAGLVRDSVRGAGGPTVLAELSMGKADFSEDALIERPAIALFGELRSETADCEGM